jgi:SAM-dependent methyltransferase
MRSYWDDAARANAAWYVDTSLDFDHPDMERFFATGRTIVSEAFDGSPVQPPGRAHAIEIGSGLGRVCLALATRFDRVTGIDISPEMVRRARELVQDPKISFVVGNGTTLDGIPDGSMDLVLSFTVFQHIPRVDVIEGYLLEAARVLRPGGLLVCQWNNGGATIPWAIRRRTLDLSRRLGVRAEEHRRRNEPEFQGSRVSLRRMKGVLDRGGMELVQTKGLGSLFAWLWAVRTA